MADTQSMVKDLISTVEQKVNQPLAQSTGELTGQFFSDPAAVRQRVVQENAGNPLDPLSIDAITSKRMGNIASQIAGNTQLASSNSDILNNFFNLINNQAQRASDVAYRNSQSRRKSYQTIQTDQGIQAYDPETGQIMPGVLGQPPGTGAATQVQQYVDAAMKGYLTNPKTGTLDLSKVPANLRSDFLNAYNLQMASQPQGPGGLAGLIGGIPLIGGPLSTGVSWLSKLLGG